MQQGTKKRLHEYHLNIPGKYPIFLAHSLGDILLSMNILNTQNFRVFPRCGRDTKIGKVAWISSLEIFRGNSYPIFLAHSFGDILLSMNMSSTLKKFGYFSEIFMLEGTQPLQMLASTVWILINVIICIFRGITRNNYTCIHNNSWCNTWALMGLLAVRGGPQRKTLQAHVMKTAEFFSPFLFSTFCMYFTIKIVCSKLSIFLIHPYLISHTCQSPRGWRYINKNK